MAAKFKQFEQQIVQLNEKLEHQASLNTGLKKELSETKKQHSQAQASVSKLDKENAVLKANVERLNDQNKATDHKINDK
ncbi:hypothetical protein [Marinomonas sp. 2405UD68-3]|uniref:hypothetical protein n=1 Tax=Marinomonas sp. 2405UD68-3 TaxID=3391835 RepID=UPI0039C9AEEB